MPLRNFDHLLLAKRLYDEAGDAAERHDRVSLTRSIILLDLSMELALKNILLNLDPDFMVDKGRRDIGFSEAWKKSHDALMKISGSGLAERSECGRVHELRNMVQHHGHEPPVDELRRGLRGARRMLVSAFRNAFSLDFDNLRSWDFVHQPDVHRLLNECEDFLNNQNPVVTVIGCKMARNLILPAIHRYTEPGHDFYPSMDWRVREGAQQMGEVGDYILRAFEAARTQVIQLETELLLVGLGLPVLDTRRFLRTQGFTSESLYEDGHMTVNISGDGSIEEANEIAMFMLNYLNRLLNALGQEMDAVLSPIRVLVPLSEQEIASNTDWFS